MAIFRMNCYSFVKQLNWKLFLGRTYLSFLFAFLSISYLPMIFGPILKTVLAFMNFVQRKLQKSIW